MKVLFVVFSDVRIYGGFEKVLFMLFNYLKQNGVDVEFLYLSKKAAIEDKSKWIEPLKIYKDRIHIETFEYTRFVNLKIAIQSLFGFHNKEGYQITKKFLEKNPPNFPANSILITNQPLYIGSLKYAVKKIHKNYKVIGWYHSSLLKKSIGFKSVREKVHNFVRINQIKYADAHFAISTGIRDQILKLEPKAKVYTVFNPIEPYSGPLIKRSKTPIFLYVGRLFEKAKNLSFMFNGLSKVKKDWKLIIVGTGPDEVKLKNLSDSRGISQKIEWRGFKKNPYENLDEGVTALLLTSRYEGFPMVLIEANQRGIPVISSNCQTGPSDIVIPGVNGYLYPEGDINAFVKIINDVIDGKLGFGTPEEIAKTAERFSEYKVCSDILNDLKEIESY